MCRCLNGGEPFVIGAIQVSYDATNGGRGYGKSSDWQHMGGGGGLTISSNDNYYFNIMKKKKNTR